MNSGGETIGPVTLEEGESTISATTTAFTLASLQCLKGAAAEFSGNINVLQAPQTVNGVLPWITMGGRFARSADGVIQPLNSQFEPFNSATSVDNVLIDAGTTSARPATIVNSLSIDQNEQLDRPAARCASNQAASTLGTAAAFQMVA